MTDINEEEIRKTIEDRVNQSGLPLEEKVHELLKKYFPIIRRNAHYLDKEQSKDRDIDFIAYNGCYVTKPKKDGRTFTVDIQFIIECKKAPQHAWIFSGKEDDRISAFEKVFAVKYYPKVLMPAFVSTEPIPSDVHIQEIIHPLTEKLFTAESYFEVKFTNKKLPNYEKDENNEPVNFLFKSILQVIKASRHRQDFQRERNQKEISKKVNKRFSIWVTVFQPVIVFDGLMYKTIKTDTKLRLEPIHFARLEKEYISSEYREMEGEIHIVSIHWISEYLEMMKKKYQIMEMNETFNTVFGMTSNRQGFL